MISLSPAREPGNGTGHISPISSALIDAGSSPVGGHTSDPTLRGAKFANLGRESSSLSGVSIQPAGPFMITAFWLVAGLAGY